MTETPETDHLENNLGNAAHPGLSYFCRKLERERDEAKEELAVWKHESEMVRAELKKADDAFESNILTFLDLREQRDKLAEVLRRVRDGYGGQVADPDCGCEDCEFLRPIDKALQFLTPNEP